MSCRNFSRPYYFRFFRLEIQTYGFEISNSGEWDPELLSVKGIHFFLGSLLNIQVKQMPSAAVPAPAW